MRTDVSPAEAVSRTHAMASDIVVRARPARADVAPDRALATAVEVFHAVDRTCTRFDPRSDLMRANADPTGWTAVAPECFAALVEAQAAYRRTHGRFDPRVLGDLVRLGYDRSMRLGPPSPRTPADLHARDALPPWTPEFRREAREVRLGPHPVDLGGIGKGLAVRWAAQLLDGIADNYLVEAGGDCACRGTAPDGEPWRVGVEDPAGGADPVAVLDLRDEAVATSSTRIRSWRVGAAAVHHLIDPVTGQPGGAGLLSVTVVDPDPAAAEVWSKTLFLCGRRGIRTSADHLGLAALWVTDDGLAEATASMQPRICWRAA